MLDFNYKKTRNQLSIQFSPTTGIQEPKTPDRMAYKENQKNSYTVQYFSFLFSRFIPTLGGYVSFANAHPFSYFDVTQRRIEPKNTVWLLGYS